MMLVTKVWNGVYDTVFDVCFGRLIKSSSISDND